MTATLSDERSQPREDRPSVLFVDDETDVLDGLRLALRPLRREFTFVYANGAAEALEILATRQIDILVSDLRMPGANGTDLLWAAREQHPTVVRYVLSGEAESELVMRAMLVAHRWLGKPCPRDELIQALRDAVRYRELLIDPKLAGYVAGIDSLPSLPARYLRIQEIMADPNSTVADVAAVAEGDPAMVAKLLQLANSAFVGRGPVHDVSGAISRIGLVTVARLMLSIEVLRPFEQPPSVPGFTPETLECFASRVSAVAGALATPAALTSASVGGLLTHLGMLVQASVAPHRLHAAYDHALQNGLQLRAAQVELDGVSHPALGGHLMSIWGLPADLVLGIVESYVPPPAGSEPPFRAAEAIRAARLIVKRWMVDDLGEPLRDRLDDAAHADLDRWEEYLSTQALPEGIRP